MEDKTNPVVIECRNFTFAYKSSILLENINFSVKHGEWLTIIGPNGSGKTTLLRNMLRLFEGGESSGEILINNQPLSSYSQIELARAVSYSPQPTGRIPSLTVVDFVNLSRFPYGFRPGLRKLKISEQTRHALALTNTSHLANRMLDSLSGGQRQRVYLAAAIAQDTSILLLDEPASFLDPRHSHYMMETLKNLHSSEKATIVMVTHDLNQPLDAGGKVLALKNSKQIFFGNTSDLIEDKTILDNTFDHKFYYVTHPLTNKPLVIA